MSDKTTEAEVKIDQRVAEHLQNYADSYERITDVISLQLEKQISRFALPKAVIPTFIQRGIEMANETAVKLAITIEANKDNLAIKSLDSTANFVGMTTQGTGELNTNLTELYFKLLETVIFRAGIEFIPPETPKKAKEVIAESMSIPNQTTPPPKEVGNEDLSNDIKKQFVLYQNTMKRPYPTENMPRELMTYFKKHKAELSEEMQGFISMLVTYVVGFTDDDKNELYPNEFSDEFLKGRAVAKTIIRRSQEA